MKELLIWILIGAVCGLAGGLIGQKFFPDAVKKKPKKSKRYKYPGPNREGLPWFGNEKRRRRNKNDYF